MKQIYDLCSSREIPGKEKKAWSKHGVLCQVCARKCEHQGKIKRLDAMIRRELDGDNAA